ncbi:hypothetical protein [Spiribacter roseus]|uniref:hypothetical protein n=1 Tax=Spiribacter roseus TaxID=1855875 RepID=UPI0013307CF9|nr:hypothetical protein [Spiribacter roseus]KAF0283013.1 hypothetical protein BA898_05790 [Spiribacter roseus]
MNQRNREKRLSRLEREALDDLHRLSDELGEHGLTVSEFASTARGIMQERFERLRGDDPPPEVQPLEDGCFQYLDTLEAVDRANALMTDRGARGLYGHQRVKANVSAQRQKWSNRKFSQGDYQAAVDRVHRESPALGWKRIKSIVAAQLGVSERTVHTNATNPHAKG